MDGTLRSERDTSAAAATRANCAASPAARCGQPCSGSPGCRRASRRVVPAPAPLRLDPRQLRLRQRRRGHHPPQSPHHLRAAAAARVSCLVRAPNCRAQAASPSSRLERLVQVLLVVDADEPLRVRRRPERPRQVHLAQQAPVLPLQLPGAPDHGEASHGQARLHELHRLDAGSRGGAGRSASPPVPTAPREPCAPRAAGAGTTSAGLVRSHLERRLPQDVRVAAEEHVPEIVDLGREGGRAGGAGVG